MSGPEAALEPEIKKLMAEFSKDLYQLHPLHKMEGVNANKESKIMLPNLDNVKQHDCDDLIMVVIELL